jgi:branched-chain amino acid transport system permease protein
MAIAGAAVKVADLWTIGAAGAALLAFFAVFRFSVIGMAMRAASSDPEAALAHGVSPQMIQGVAWAVAGALAVVAGVLIGSGARGVDLTMTAVALRAFPAMILGGLDSPGGAVAGGLLVGLTEVLAAAYITPNVPGLGNNVHVVVPYLVMILVLVVRPYGLFGTVEVRRV